MIRTFVPLSVLCFMALAKPVVIPQTHPFYVKLSETEAGLLRNPQVPVVAFSCKPVPAVSPTATGGASAVAIEQLPFRLDQTGYYLKDLFFMIAMADIGKEPIRTFIRKYESGEIKIEQITSEGMSRCPKQALACYFPMGKIMYIDKSATMASLAPIFFHEVLHALDEENAAALKKVDELNAKMNKGIERLFQAVVEKSKKDMMALTGSDFAQSDVESIAKLKIARDQVLELSHFKTERVAYDGGTLIEKQFAGLFPQFYERLSPREVSSEQIVKSYGFNSGVIERFLRGFCQEASAMAP